MSDTGKDKITIRLSKSILGQIDDYVERSGEFKTRSDFVRHLIKTGGAKMTMCRAPHVSLHQKTFKEILKYLKDEDIANITKKNSLLVHSIMQDSKKTSLQKIKKEEATSFIKNVYESTGLVREMHFKKEDNGLAMCLSGESMENQTVSKFIKAEMINVMRPWYKLKSFSGTPGNIILVFE
jgi:Arc/MetJ-type ribon-helix-helix transcriptional regulator